MTSSRSTSTSHPRSAPPATSVRRRSTRSTTCSCSKACARGIAERPAVPRLGPRGPARAGVSGTRRYRHLRVRGSGGDALRRQLGHQRRVRPAGRDRAQRRAATAAVDLSRHRVSAGQGRAGPRTGRDRGREPYVEPRRSRHPPGGSRRGGRVPALRSPISPASTCSPARRSRACSGPRWSVARRASRSVTSRSCSPTSGDRPRSISGSAI